MSHAEIDPDHKLLRGIRAIAEHIGQSPQITRRMILRRTIDADQDGKVYFTTPARIKASFAGRRRTGGEAS